MARRAPAYILSVRIELRTKRLQRWGLALAFGIFDPLAKPWLFQGQFDRLGGTCEEEGTSSGVLLGELPFVLGIHTLGNVRCRSFCARVVAARRDPTHEEGELTIARKARHFLPR